MSEVKRGQLEIRCYFIQKLFIQLMATSSRFNKEQIVLAFRQQHPKLEKDLDFCFEVLAGYHKLGYTYGTYKPVPSSDKEELWKRNEDATIRRMVEGLKEFGSSWLEVQMAYDVTPPNVRTFIENLVNRNYKLGYSNKKAMVTSLSPMLAKKYPETVREGHYYIQEKLDGNRCIASYNEETGKWEYTARSGKPLKVDFDMSWADKNYIYDGEVMTLGHAGTRDFNHTSGVINGKYTDKSQLHYFIYDIVADDLTYKERWKMLRAFGKDDEVFGWFGKVSENCTILNCLDNVYVYPNPEYNGVLDQWLDYIVEKGGEGIIMRDPDAYYEHKRCNGLLKYKKTQTMDLRIIDWNEGKGKYYGAIGSFVCETDDHNIVVNVAGMSDEIRFSDPKEWIGKIIEVAYFDQSKSERKDASSLRFPRFKRVRDDKTETSIY